MTSTVVAEIINETLRDLSPEQIKSIIKEQLEVKFLPLLQLKMPEKSFVSIVQGVKYTKIVSTSYGSRSVWGFIDLKNGDILKAASWNRPAKHARGNIFEPGIVDRVEWTGPRYMR